MKSGLLTFVGVFCLANPILPRASAQMPMAAERLTAGRRVLRLLIDNDLGRSETGTFDTITVQP